MRWQKTRRGAESSVARPCLDDGARMVVDSGSPPLIRLGAKPRISEYLRALWARREFALAIPRAELQARTRNTALGGLWHLLSPMFQVGVYYVVFGVVLDGRAGIENFVGFLAIGVFIFHFTSRSVSAGARAIVSNEGLIRAVSFPRAILPLSVVLAELATFGYALIAMFGIVLVTGEQPAWTWLLFLPVMALQFAFNLGAAMIVARLTHHVRDVTQVLPFLLRMWLYLSGIFWDVATRLADAPPVILAAANLNPAYAFITIVRRAILDGAVAPARFWIVAGAWAVASLTFGFLFFRAHEHEYGRG